MLVVYLTFWYDSVFNFYRSSFKPLVWILAIGDTTCYTDFSQEELNQVVKMSLVNFLALLTWFEISMNDTVVVAVLDTLQDLLDALGRVGLGVELPGHDVLKQLAACDEVEHKVVAVLFLEQKFNVSGPSSAKIQLLF